MNSNRWYEKHDRINELIDFVENLPQEDQKEIAQHFFQIMIKECDINLDKEFSMFGKNNYSYKRWYDENCQISTALELLKKLPEEIQMIVVDRVFSEVIVMYSKRLK